MSLKHTWIRCEITALHLPADFHHYGSARRSRLLDRRRSRRRERGVERPA
jgi:hypothetical protein